MIRELNDFSRIRAAVDLETMREAHVVCVGTGGAYSLLEGLCRSGIGKLTLIDPDHVEEANVVRQGFALADIGRPKVDALVDHLRGLNGGTRVNGIPRRLQDIGASDLDKLFSDVKLLIGVTDSFPAQAYANILALRHRVPALWGGFYDRSRGGELFFSIPGITRTCFRCVLWQRYDAFEAEGEPVLSSSCNTIFHSMYLDAQLGFIALAILNRYTLGLEFSNWFGQHWDYNFIQFKINPWLDAGEGNPFQQVFAGAAGWSFNAVWHNTSLPGLLKDTCPDCGRTEALHVLAERMHNEP
ncbi:MAG TPA: ThiF family adenylyltransferase [Flavobacteriales bacterium]|nr:ThiF family adenylyltransferase [Flavobacteriales bacterium]HMR28791.1 ThiF family adenylyltransferase [Flavobacteriales bacterium]